MIFHDIYQTYAIFDEGSVLILFLQEILYETMWRLLSAYEALKKFIIYR